jgi:hypothetical protein
MQQLSLRPKAVYAEDCAAGLNLYWFQFGPHWVYAGPY